MTPLDDAALARLEADAATHPLARGQTVTRGSGLIAEDRCMLALPDLIAEVRAHRARARAFDALLEAATDALAEVDATRDICGSDPLSNEVRLALRDAIDAAEAAR